MGKRALLKALLKAKRLDQVKGDEEVRGMIDDLLVSPVLTRVLCQPTNFSFNSDIILAELDRAELGDFDALVLGLFLMAHFKGQSRRSFRALTSMHSQSTPVRASGRGFVICTFHTAHVGSDQTT
jgi:hypothetical protein